MQLLGSSWPLEMYCTKIYDTTSSIISHVRGFEHHFTRQQEQFGDLQEMFWHVTRNASKWLRIWSIDGGSLSLFLEFGEFLQIQQNQFFKDNQSLFQITIHIQDTGLQSRDDSQNHTDAAFCWVPKMNRPFWWSYREVLPSHLHTLAPRISKRKHWTCRCACNCDTEWGVGGQLLVWSRAHCNSE